MKIKRVHCMLFLKTIFIIEFSIGAFFLWVFWASDFPQVGNLMVTVIMWLLSAHTLYASHQDYRWFNRYKSDEKHEG